jgi:hypothetical protein
MRLHTLLLLYAEMLMLKFYVIMKILKKNEVPTKNLNFIIFIFLSEIFEVSILEQ